ncbi:low specificity L-threonine aldolase [Apibacter sp. HY039]|uniref:threonine aldolase family protein n=1 Tax=Apibacter sp. HY039 TaxID=2501476 RepID=UPI000FEC09FA|nr:beta-eliminating lyase-related protein [Apibacter sp. HY039]
MSLIYSFANDYSEGCHPSILENLTVSNYQQFSGYGEDPYTLESSEIIRNKINNSKADVHLIAGGTLTNLLVLGAILKPFESVISAESGHINTHEAGAIEATGHKIETVLTTDGKLSPELILPVLNKFPPYHTVKPKVVYISNSTELGTIYKKNELIKLYEFCRENNLLLYLDGARLASGMAASSNDLTLEDIAKYTDIFYLGATKCGGLIGEALIITHNDLKTDFKYHIKQRGAMLAKGRLLGIQFYSLLKDDLIFKLAHHSNLMAVKLTSAFKEKNFSFLTESHTNQIFPILPNSLINKLQNKFNFFIWQPLNTDKSVIRLITSWATSEKAVDEFINEISDFTL